MSVPSRRFWQKACARLAFLQLCSLHWERSQKGKPQTLPEVQSRPLAPLAGSFSCRPPLSHHLSGDRRERTSSAGLHYELCGDDKQLCVSLVSLKPVLWSPSAASGPLWERGQTSQGVWATQHAGCTPASACGRLGGLIGSREALLQLLLPSFVPPSLVNLDHTWSASTTTFKQKRLP